MIVDNGAIRLNFWLYWQPDLEIRYLKISLMNFLVKWIVFLLIIDISFQHFNRASLVNRVYGSQVISQNLKSSFSQVKTRNNQNYEKMPLKSTATYIDVVDKWMLVTLSWWQFLDVSDRILILVTYFGNIFWLFVHYFFVCALFFVHALFCVFELYGTFVVPWRMAPGSILYDCQMFLENTCHRCEIPRKCKDSCQRCENTCCEFPGNLNLTFDLGLTLNLTAISRVF